MRKVYIAGKITGNKSYRRDFMIAEKTIRKACEKVKICNPIFVRPFLGIENWLCYMIVAVKNVIWATDIFLISNWHRSRGAKIEKKIGRLLNKQIWLLHDKPQPGPSEIIKQRDNRWFVYQAFRGRKIAIKKVIPQIQKL
jgi:hypothetical protein